MRKDGYKPPARSLTSEERDQRLLRKLVAEHPHEALEALLGGVRSFWPNGVELNRPYKRSGDDSNGGHVKVMVSEDGDAHVSITEPDERGDIRSASQRFNARTGGTTSPCTRRALLFLALAIKLDNEKRPPLAAVS